MPNSSLPAAPSRPASTSRPASSGASSPRALPEYAAHLAAMHRAHAPELARLMASLPFLSEGPHLDVACGDGTFARLAQQHTPEVWALDQNPAYLELAREATVQAGLEIQWVQGDAFSMPFEDASFDSAFCAQSCYSLGAVAPLLKEMKRVVRPGGWCALLENDSLHHVLLPWPPALELELRKAEFEVLSARCNETAVFYMARRLSERLREAGFERTEQKTFATERRAPLGSDEQTFLKGYLGELVRRVRGHLTAKDLALLDRVLNGDEQPPLLERSDLNVVVLDVLAIGWVGGSDQPRQKRDNQARSQV